jgi:hypothetical protein
LGTIRSVPTRPSPSRRRRGQRAKGSPSRLLRQAHPSAFASEPRRGSRQGSVAP